MEATIINGVWKGHLGRGLAHKELQYLLSAAQGMTAKQIARQFDVAACTVTKRLSCAMFKLGVTRQTAMIAEAMRRQIISPMCFLLAALIAMHAMIGDESMRRDRRVPERRTAQVRMVRCAEQPVLLA
jgi:DNA-binding CsgD family transcriptional regulator